MVYSDKNAWAITQKYADWDAYAAANPNAPPSATIEGWIEEASWIINENIGSYDTDITDTKYLTRVQQLCNRMVNRMMQIDIGQGLVNKIPMFSPNDFLIDRERRFLQMDVGVNLGYRSLGGASTNG